MYHAQDCWYVNLTFRCQNTEKVIDWICPNTQKGEGQVLISASLSVAPGQGIKGLDVVRHGVSLRPARKGGPRVARDVVEGVDVVHNYGHGVFAYQIS